MDRSKTYRDLKGRTFVLADLDRAEQELVRTLTDRAKRVPDWNDFSNFWLAEVSGFYARRGFGRVEIRRKVVYRIAQDLDSRLAVQAGVARAPDYRDDLEDLVSTRFPTRRAFCEATGLSEDMLSHVLARRKHLAIDKLSEALARIGYSLHIEPIGAEQGE